LCGKTVRMEQPTDKKFILLFGPSAVGKMTVGQALARRTGLKLFHNHMSIELAFRFFEFGTPQFTRLDRLFRFEIFKEVAQSDLPGLIFTCVWAFDEPSNFTYIDDIVAIFEKEGATTYYVELEADLDIRLKRNKHPHRLEHKPTKRDLERAETVLLYDEEHHQLNSDPGTFDGKPYVRIDNTDLSPTEVVDQILAHFGWTDTDFSPPMAS
jgi:hypothetical protein